jgi:hypothetical protein
VLHLKGSPSLFLSLSLALMTWLVFYPGIFSVDSLVTYQEALSGEFSDIRSSFLTILFSLFLKAGGQVGLLALLMCLAGFLGIRRLSLAVIHPLTGVKRFQELSVSTVVVLLVSPLTPLAIYLVTFWFDTWLMLLLIWALALLLELWNEQDLVSYPKNRGKLFTLVILVAMILLARPNSILLYPFFVLALISIPGFIIIPRRILLVLTLFPLLFFLFYIPVQYNLIGVKRVNPEKVAVALDLASLLTYDRSICDEVRLSSCELVIERFPQNFYVGKGAIDHTLNHGLVKTEPAFASLMASPGIYHDLWLAASHYPWSYIKVKVLNFLDFIRPRDRFYFQSTTHPNSFGLHLSFRFQEVRNTLYRIMHTVYQHPLLRFFSFVPFPWMLVALVGMGRGIYAGKKNQQAWFLGMILLIPLAYCFSYLLVMTTSDFRFVYPAILLVQVISLMRLFQVLSSRFLI